MKYTPEKCVKCGCVYNKDGAYHSCKEERERLLKEISDWKDKYFAISAKYQAALKEIK